MTEPQELKILCPFCNAIWVAEMETDFDYSMGSEYTGIYNETIKVEIKCSNCKKLIYTKENA
jgi:formate dehydrogenase maturation protein FdhE